MAIKKINIGQVPNDKKGDKFRDAFSKANDNFSELDTRATAAQNTADAAKAKADAALPESRVQTDALSAVVGALLAISNDGRGAFGLGAQAAPDWPNLDLNDGSSVPPSGLFRYTSAHSGTPPGGGSSGTMLWIRYTSTAGYLAVLSGTTPTLHLRRWVNNVWSTWYRADVRGVGLGVAGTDTATLVADFDDDSLPAGHYRYNSTSAGLPALAGAAGTLEVVHQQNGYRTQIITENSASTGSAGRRGWRVRKNGVWQPWREVMSEGSTVQYGGSLSGSGVDLNQATRRGLYIVPSTSIASDGLNFPIRTSGLLEVLASYGMDYVGTMTTGLIQRYTSANRNRAFQRTLVNSTWTDWRESAFVDSVFPMLRPSSYTKTTVPAAASSTGGVVYVTNAAGGAALAVSNGTAWISQLTGTEV
ncbi:pyocin knob domain-containing protein [Bordetella trematum]|uniref:pyocin knob domain-containing protein n=1 Tax=Bordetella trematum TaxID=123899 RepID=UPI0015C5635D|nr:pyocin knob domain-containing protein [Bordetella trematum]